MLFENVSRFGEDLLEKPETENASNYFCSIALRGKRLYYYGARYLNPRTSRWVSADPAIGEYLPVAPVNDEARKHNANLPGMGGVFYIVNLALYQYGGNNPVRYVDPDGSIIMIVPSLYKMNKGVWRDDWTGNGVEDKRLRETGCAITVMSNIVSTATRNGTTPCTINAQKDNFSFNTDDLSMQKVGENSNLKFDYWTKEHTDLSRKLKELDSSSGQFYIAAQVKYNAAGDSHWVGVNDVIEFDGKAYIEVSASSTFDRDKDNRPRSTWSLRRNGKMYIEVSDINKIYTFKKEQE